MKFPAPLLILIAFVPVSAFAQSCEGWNTDTFWDTATNTSVTECIKSQPVTSGDQGTWSTPIQLAAATSSDPAVFMALADAGVDFNITDGFGATPLHIAAHFNKNSAVIEALVNGGADLNARDIDGQTALHAAARGNNPQIVKALIAAGADVNALDDMRHTPLHMAVALHNAPEILDSLVTAGANLRAETLLGNTPFDYIKDVVFLENTAMFELLKPATRMAKNN